MIPNEYLNKIDKLKIEHLGFDTHARVLGITKKEAKKLWNQATDFEFKRMPRTEYTMRFMPEYSTKFRSYWRLESDYPYIMFYLTPTTPILIPNGFITDKGSIPLVFRNLISHDDREMISAFLVHDVECEKRRMTRFLIDALLYEVGTEMEANWFKKNFIYTAVRAAAWLPSKDRIMKDGFNISEYNRKLIDQTELNYMGSKKEQKHFEFVESIRDTI